MSLDADSIVERRRLRRKLSFWRIAAFLVAAVAILAVASYGARDRFGEQIARVPISGVITDDWAQREFLRKLGENDRVKAVILAINSPGGTTGGGEAMYEAVRALADKKPVVASIGTVGASAAYLTAIAADHVVARETSITGSIGVIFQWANLGELAKNVGVDMRAIKSDPLKAEPSPFNEDTPQERRVIEDMISDTHGWFVDKVAERRGMSAAQARALADGRVFSGTRAHDLDIVDALGGEDVAKAWLVAERGISADAQIKEWTADGPIDDFAFGARLSSVFGWLSGVERIVTRLANLVPEEGLVSLWRPQTIEE